MKKNLPLPLVPSVRELLALLEEFGIRRVIHCPGSRNMPLAAGFAAFAAQKNSDWKIHYANDERSAAFLAVGMAAETGEPVALSCTSGSALLNMTPAVAEAYYRHLPILVISADRSAAWIGQKDGQTVPQAPALHGIVNYACSLPDAPDSESLWHANRLLNEALLHLTRDDPPGPVHINLPIREPFFECADSIDKPLLPTRRIRQTDDLEEVARFLARFPKRLLLIGQDFADRTVQELPHFAVAASHLANAKMPSCITRLDDLVVAAGGLPEDLLPNCVVTAGGHLLSNAVKRWIRKYPMMHHVDLGPEPEVGDLFRILSLKCRLPAKNTLQSLARLDALLAEAPTDTEWQAKLFAAAQGLPVPACERASQLALTGEFLKALPPYCALHLANSTAVRAAQVWPVNPSIDVACNRGMNGTEGALSAAIGAALAAPDRTVALLIGDLSFYYDVGSLFNTKLPRNLRVLVIHNNGGTIFRTLKGLQLPDPALDAVTGTAIHGQTPVSLPEIPGADCRRTVVDGPDWREVFRRDLRALFSTRGGPRILEVATDGALDAQAWKDHYANLRAHLEANRKPLWD